MQNLLPARSLARRSRNLLIAAIFLMVLGVLTAVTALFLYVVPILSPSNSSYDFYLWMRAALAWFTGIIIVAALLMALRALTWKRENPIAAQVGEILAQDLDERYTYIRNLNRNALGYIDAVLVGPPGVLVFRVTNRAGTFFNEGADWMIQKDKGEWHTLRWSPTREAIQDIQSVRDFLAARNLIDIPVFGAVVFTEDEPATRVTKQDPVVPVVQPFELSYGLESGYFADRNRLDQQTANRIARELFGS